MATAVLLGCGGTSAVPAAVPALEPAAGAGRFPSRAELDEIAGRAAPAASLETSEVVVESWDLIGPFPDEVGVAVYEAATPWEQMLAEAVAGTKTVASLGMHCAARELGQLYLAQQRQPSRELRRFVASRCGSVATDVDIGVLSGDAADELPEEKLFEAWRESLAKMIEPRVRGDHRVAGIWFGRRDGRAVVALATGLLRAEIARADRVPDQYGRITVEGELLGSSSSARALINRGRYGVAGCALDPLVALPRFRALCAPEPTDGAAWIEIAAFPPDRVLGRTVLNVLTWPAGEAPKRYQRVRHADQRSVRPQEDVAAVAVEIVNGVRANAGLPAVALAAEESATAAKLAPHYFTALLGYSDATLADRVALGLMGGWQVDARLRRGWFSSRLLSGTDDLGTLISAMLESPFGREVLLNPDAAHAAVGAVVQPVGDILGVLVASYAVMPEIDRDEAATSAWTRLTEQRRAQSLPEPARLAQAQAFVDEAARKVHEVGTSPEVALDRLLASSVKELGVQVRGWTASGSALDEIEFPKELVTLPDAVVALSVAVYRPENEPWVRYVVFAVAAEPTERYDQIRLPGAEPR